MRYNKRIQGGGNVLAFNKSLVDIPDDEGVHVKTAGAKGEKYVYKHVKYFRNSEGKPRNRSKAIGKFDASCTKMLLSCLSNGCAMPWQWSLGVPCTPVASWLSPVSAMTARYGSNQAPAMAK